MFAQKNVEKPLALFCPLNWGLGHAGRTIPLIEDFLKEDFRVVVAASGRALAFLQMQLGDKVEYLDYPGYSITYGKGRWPLLKLIRQTPTFLISVIREYGWMKKTVARMQPAVIVSDNRYGARSRTCYSIIITHQLKIPFPNAWVSTWLSSINRLLIRRFDACWVPDFEASPGLAGELSHPHSRPDVEYLGPLSRFKKSESAIPFPLTEEPPPAGFILVMLSGPEPQRSILEQELKKKLKTLSVVWLRGIPGSITLRRKKQHYWHDHAPDDLLAWYIGHAGFVISRPGYSTLMDLAVFGKKAIVIPTPGQPEQKYLGQWMQKQNYVLCLDQENIMKINDYILLVSNCKGIPVYTVNGERRQQLHKLRQLIQGKTKAD